MSYGDLDVLKNLSLTVNKGDVVAVIGPSCSGNSTMLICINYLEVIKSGKILVDGQEVVSNERIIRSIRQKLGMVFQLFNLFPHLTVYENIALNPKII